MDKGFLKRYTMNNGFTSEIFSILSPGEKFIISPKGDKETFFIPEEITIKTITKILEDPDDLYSSPKYEIITTAGHKPIYVDDLIMCPNCEEYNIYLNWDIYIKVFRETIENKYLALDRLKDFITKSSEFMGELSEIHPDKFI